MCRCHPSLLVLPVVLRVYKMELKVSVVGISVVVAFFPSAVQTSSIVSQISQGGMGIDDPRMAGGVGFQYWLKYYWLPALLFDCCTDKCNQLYYAVKKMCAGYLQVTIYMSKVCMFNCWVWWLVSWQDVWCTLWLCQIACQWSRTQMGHLCTMSFTLHDLIFHLAWFSMCR